VCNRLGRIDMLVRIKFPLTLLTLLFLMSVNLSAKDFDTTLEKPEEKAKPDNHRIFLRMLGGDGSMITPAQEEIRGSDNAATIASLRTSTPSIYASTFGPQYQDGKDTTSTRQYDLEYRYLDKFRIFYENRKITQKFTYGSIVASSFSLSGIPVDFTDTQKRFGIGYFYPIFSMLNVGVTLRHVELQQTTESDFLSIRTRILSPTVTVISDSKQSVKMTGYVPGIALEFKPLSWFEIHVQHLNFNLKGNDMRNQFAYASVGNQSTSALSIGDGNATYRGYSQTIDFVFRYSSWFATRWGYTRENFLKTNGVFSFDTLGGNPVSAIGDSLFLQAFSEASVKYGSYNVTIEFSKGFGSNL
jgi:hypothetical protein